MMQSAPTRPPQWFVRELAQIHSDLRLVWGRESHGVALWVIERRIPPDIHAHCLEEFEGHGETRYFDQKLTDGDGNVVGSRHFDRVPEWAIGHIIADREYDLEDPRAYREPAARDLASVRRWLFEYKNMEEQIRAMRNEREVREAKKKQEKIDFLKDGIQNERLWGAEFVDVGRKKPMKGTRIK